MLRCCRALGEISDQTERVYRNLTEQNFDPAKAHVNRALKRALGERRASPYRIMALNPIVGTRCRRFGLALPPAAVAIAAASKFGQPTVNSRAAEDVTTFAIRKVNYPFL